MTTVKRFAEETVEKAQNTGKKYAVFMINGKIKRTSTTTNLFRNAMEKCERSLVGVYDDRCDPKWIEEDLSYAMGI